MGADVWFAEMCMGILFAQITGFRVHSSRLQRFRCYRTSIETRGIALGFGNLLCTQPMNKQLENGNLYVIDFYCSRCSFRKVRRKCGFEVGGMMTDQISVHTEVLKGPANLDVHYFAADESED